MPTDEKEVVNTVTVAGLPFPIRTERKVRNDGVVYFNAYEVDGYDGIGMCIGLGSTEQEAIDDLVKVLT